MRGPLPLPPPPVTDRGAPAGHFPLLDEAWVALPAEVRDAVLEACGWDS